LAQAQLVVGFSLFFGLRPNHTASSMLNAFLSLVCVAILAVDAQTDLPTVEISLDPPRNPYPSLSAAITKMETNRESSQADHMSNLQSVMKEELQYAEERIQQVARRFTSGLGKESLGLIEKSEGSLSAYVSVISSPWQPTRAIEHKVDTMEQKLTAADESWFRELAREARELTDFIVEVAESEMREAVATIHGASASKSASGFLKVSEARVQKESLPHMANVQVIASSVPYPSFASLVQDMETRREISENLERARALDLLSTLMSAENDLLEKSLRSAIGF
jgi:hypothetical protein